MFKLILKDSKGTPLKEGDLVRLTGRIDSPVFYCEVTFLEEEKRIVPFHSFSFNHIERVDKLPSDAIPLKEERYKAYMSPSENVHDKNYIDNYLMDWRVCEHRINERCFDIERLK